MKQFFRYLFICCMASGLHTAAFAQGNINRIEYFFDTDPGFGNAVAVSMAAAPNISALSFNADVSALAPGMHTLFVRSKSTNGRWSLSGKLLFAKVMNTLGDPHGFSRINRAEYFYDTDPGFGNGTDIPVSPAYDLSGMSVNTDVSGLPNGMHTLYIRTRDSLGQWTQADRLLFAKFQPVFGDPDAISNIVKAEYYYDTDPGFNNGMGIPVTAGTDIPAMVFNADVSALPGGMHTLYIRTQDAGGKWSLVNRSLFAKVQSLAGNPLTAGNINRIEYFVDTDPGIGSGTPVTFTPGTDIASLNFNVDMTILVNDNHRLYLRSRDAGGRWSITGRIDFLGGSIPLSVKLVSFDASLQKNNTVLLEWVTAQEDRVSYYMIERSSDASSWTLVGKKDPVTAGASQKRTYRLTDTEPGTGLVYYRLTEVDLNGTATRAPIRFVRIDNTDIKFASVYPNPNDGSYINISSGMLSGEEVSLTIIGVDGKIAFRQLVNGNSGNTLTLSGLQLAPGNYFINLQDKNRSESLKLEVTAK